VVLLDNRIPSSNPLLQGELEDIIREEQERVADYGRKFHREGLPDLTSKRVILVDDGLATGATTEAAVQSVRRRNASVVVVAVPVASTNAIERLQRVADQVRALVIDPGFEAVGSYYEYFNQTSDEEVIELLDSRGQFH
jgi:predicted phosphoribosyltransferase